MSVPPHPYGHRLSLLLTWGEEAEATKLLESLNCIQTAFGQPAYDMPEPWKEVSGFVVSAERVTQTVERDLKFTMELQNRRAA